MKAFFERLYDKSDNQFYREMKRNLQEETKMFIITANPEAFMYGEKLFEYGNELGKTIFLFGAKPEIVEQLNQVLRDEYKDLKVVGTENGYVQNKDAVFEKMKQLQPDIVLVALGMPQQEKLIYKHLKDFEKGIFVGVGGSFDVLSGMKHRAPHFLVKHNIEWLYRITKEPYRLKRFYNSNIKFIFRVMFDKNLR